MDTSKLKKFAQFARSSLIEQVDLKLDTILAADSLARRESAEAVKTLEKAISNNSREYVIERVAYIWFNRFCALRFMDVNRYTRVGVVSPTEGQFQPEILAEAKMGHIDEDMVPAAVRQEIQSLLSGRTPSRDSQGEAYRLLVVAACRDWHRNMPFLFQHIDDYTELLLPDDLLSENSILAHTREAMTPDACESVEVIGWLYQFYISEKKDQIFEGLKKNQKITPNNIPAATQLFTPHWIVRYLVQNSLGRLWLLNRPQSRLAEQMEYYIPPEQPDTDFLKINGPEDIKVCDPACGSGHMLTYAFDLLYDIYEEEGYNPSEIPENILTHNLYGIELDERAGELAAFALTMKARERQRRFFSKGIRPNICVLENIRFDEDELKHYIEFVGHKLFTVPLQTTLRQFEEANNFGSLIRPNAADVRDMLRVLETKDVAGQLFINITHQKVLKALRQADYLNRKYHIAIANPPYMNSKGMTERTKKFAEKHYHSVKSNLFSMFMVRIPEIVKPGGGIGLMTPISWMSLSSFEALRLSLLEHATITSFIQPEYNAFWDSAHVAICAFTLQLSPNDEYEGTYINLAGFYGAEIQSIKALEAIKNKQCSYRYQANGSCFKKIPGSPIAYWIKGISNFNKRKVGDLFISGGRNKTHNNEKYLRFCWEVSIASSKWMPYANGGDFRKYCGNDLEVIDWSEPARKNYESHGGLVNPKFFGKEGITWSLVTSAINGFRIKYESQQYSSGSPTIFNKNFSCDYILLGILNSTIADYYLKAINPTVNTTVSDVLSLPYMELNGSTTVIENVTNAISISRKDWDSFETSQSFKSLQLLEPHYRRIRLNIAIENLHTRWRTMTLAMQRLEEENNRIFIDAYGLQDELTPDVPLKEITLTRNPHYRYGGDKTEEELEALLLADTMREFISYAVGCMFGRYSLDKPGLILANQGETLADYLAQVPEPTFMPDKDNVIPMLDGDWFADDIAERFRRFLRVTFGEEHYEENLRFIEEALNVKGKRSYSLRDYFLSEFYTDHLKRYKKRPIYWLFSSPKGSFNALIYMHRYRPDTVSVVLNDYLREFRAKLLARKNHLEALGISASASQGEKTKALKEIEKISKMIAEVDAYERDTLYPLATQQLEIDLDDGVKANYPKFGAALKKIPGLEAKDD